MKIIPTLLLLFLLSAVTIEYAAAQSLPDSTVAKINRIFRRWDKNTSPGCVVGIIRNDSLIFSKGYGMANLEYSIPNAPSTIFHMASVSKQFTAYSIVLLAKQGKLKLDDDVRKYLPWFPKLKATITIRNLLNHTSGIRDQWQLLAISGTRLDDVITQDQVIKILSKQQALNFMPGEQYSYSNSGFTMLSEIVKSVSGRSLRQFTDSAIFKPLGMNDTHFHDDYEEIVKGRSYSYDDEGNEKYKNAVLSYSVSGATSLFTDINDMAKWVENFYTPVAGDANDIKQLTQKGKLNSGKEIDYALGINNGKYKGWQQFSHSGGDAGYRTFVSVFPGAKMGFLVFCNLGNMNPNGLTEKLQDIFIKDISGQGKDVGENDEEEKLPEPLKEAEIKKYAGDYISDEGTRLQLTIKEGRIYCYTNSDTDVLVKQSKDSFTIAGSAGFAFVFSNPGVQMKAKVVMPDVIMQLNKYVPVKNPSDDLLQAYVGNYYCPELECYYGIQLKNHQLVLTNPKYNDAAITLAGTDHLFTDNWWMNHLLVKRNSTGKITGFEVNSGRIMHLAFNKRD